LSCQKDCSNSSLSKLLRQFYNKGKIRFYLSEFAEESGRSMKEVEDYFIALLSTGKIEGKLELRCPNCGKDFGLFNRISEIPESITCEFCGHKFAKAMEYIEVILEIKKPFFRDQENISCDNSQESSRQGPIDEAIE
jgi:DNA-directed RNA polymerase subunit RPC12/RpoP